MPVDFILNGFSAQNKSSLKKLCDQVGTALKMLDRATPWENSTELHIGLLKEDARKEMIESNSPMVL